MLRLLIALLVLAPVAFAPSIANAQVKIVIDPGHGGTDPGGTGLGREEKVFVLDVSKRFEALLKADTADEAGGGKWTASLTRTTDVFISLAGRSQYSNAQGADRFMSIHSNAFADSSANGTETFSLTATGTGSQLRNLVQAEMIAAWGLTNRGNKTANFAVLRDTAAPAELHELAFITNPTDSAKLASETERQKAALAHLRALQKHYSLAPYEPNAMPQTEPTDITGTVLDGDGPIEGATVALDGGTSVTTDAAGKFRLAEVTPGPQTVIASAPGHPQKAVSVTVALGVTSDIVIDLSTDDGSEEPEPETGLNGDAIGGCATSSGASWFGLVGLVALVALRRRRRAE
jgi:MYXO-CTERM domain-containing protein